MQQQRPVFDAFTLYENLSAYEIVASVEKGIVRCLKKLLIEMHNNSSENIQRQMYDIGKKGS